MNKYLTLGAAALFAGTAAAGAATYTFTFGTVNGGSYCDGGTLRTNNGSIRGAEWTHINDNCDGSTSQGYGFLTKVGGQGKFYAMSDDIYGRNYNIYSEQLVVMLPAKPKNGAHWSVWIGLDAVTLFQTNSGVLVNVTNGKNYISGSGTKSTTSAVRQAIAAHRTTTK